MQLWLPLPYTHQHPFLPSSSFMGSTFIWAMRDLALISSSSWGNLNISHLPASNHKTTGQSLTIKHFQSPMGWIIEVSTAGAVCCPLDQPHTTSCCWGWQGPASADPRGRWAVGDTKSSCRNVGSIMVCWALCKICPQSRYRLQCAIWVTLLKASGGIFHFLLPALLNFSYTTMPWTECPFPWHPCCGREVGTTWSLRFLSTQTVLWFYEYWEI